MIKIADLPRILEIRKQLRAEGKTVVFTNGCFDILHGGHIHLFQQAKQLGDILMVGVNDDASIRFLKGRDRPIFPLSERLEILAALDPVDYLIPFSEDTPRRLISQLLPDVLVKGGDWKPDEVVGRAEVEAAGGRVVIISYLPGSSTSAILARIRECSPKP